MTLELLASHDESGQRHCTASVGVIIPGGLLTAGSTRIYRYLRRSVLDFDGVRAFEARLGRAGFTGVRTMPMDGWQRGIVHSFLAQRPR